MAVETVFLDTIDGVSVEVDILRHETDRVPATVVIAHPHPLYGGDRHNPVVKDIQKAAWEAGCSSIAVDFRGVGNSGGMHDDGDAERLDLAAACEFALDIHPDSPIVIAGYSFGAVVGLNVSHPYIAGWLALAPPVALMPSPPLAARSHHRKFVAMPDHDQFTSIEAITTELESWSNTELVVAADTDHFFASGALDLASRGLARLLASS